MRVFIKESDEVTEPPEQGSSLYFFQNSVIRPVEYLSDFSIRYVEKGQVETYANDRKVLIGPGQLFIVKPGTRIRSRSMSRITGLSFFMGFNHYQDILKVDDNIFRRGEDPRHFQSNTTVIPESLHECLISCLKKAVKDQPSTDQLINDVIISIQKDFDIKEEKLDRISRKKLSTKQDILYRLESVRIKLENVTTKFDLNQIADSASMSKFALIRSFKQVYGLTPKQYHIRKKVAFASGLLFNERNSVKETASRCGYPDIFSFSKQFKMIMGCCPSRQLQMA